MASRTGRTNAVARSLRASQMPVGKPMTMQKNTDVNTRAKVIIASSHAPTMPITAMEIIALMAIRRPAACQASRPMMTIISSAGVTIRECSIPVSTVSMGQRTAWKTGRKLDTSQLSACSTQTSSGIRV